MSRGSILLVAATLAAAALVVAYLLAGGGSYEPTPSADPCAPRAWRSPQGIEESAQQFALSALDGAACELRVSREQLAVALVDERSRAEFAAARGIDEAELEQAVRAGVIRGLDDAESAGALSPVIADGLRALAGRLPVDESIALIEDASRLFAGAEELLGDVVDRIEGFLPDL